MTENKEEPLNINNATNPKGRQNSIRKKRADHKKKKLSSKIRVYIIVALIVFATLFCCLCFLIFKKLRLLSQLKETLEIRKKELDEGDKTRLELMEKIDTVEKQIENKKRYVKEKREIDAQKLEEYNEQKKIFDNVEEMQNNILRENEYSLVLDEAINNLNRRLNNLSK